MLLHLITLLKVYFPELNREEGQGMAEYGLILALISVGAIAVLVLLGPMISDAFQGVADGMPVAP